MEGIKIFCTEEMTTIGTFKRIAEILIEVTIYKSVGTVKETTLENHLGASNREPEVAIGGSSYQKPETT